MGKNRARFTLELSGNRTYTLSPDHEVYVPVAGEKYYLIRVKDLPAGQKVLAQTPAVSIDEYDLESILLQDESYKRAKESWHAQNSQGEYIPILSTYLLKALCEELGVVGLESRKKILQESIDGKQFAFTNEEKRKIRELFAAKVESFASLQSLDIPVQSTLDAWLFGETIAPKEWSYFTLFEQINEDFCGVAQSRGELGGMHHLYSRYTTIRRWRTRYIELMRGKVREMRAEGAQKSQIKDELREEVEAKSKDEQYPSDLIPIMRLMIAHFDFEDTHYHSVVVRRKTSTSQPPTASNSTFALTTRKKTPPADITILRSEDLWQYDRVLGSSLQFALLEFAKESLRTQRDHAETFLLMYYQLFAFENKLSPQYMDIFFRQEAAIRTMSSKRRILTPYGWNGHPLCTLSLEFYERVKSGELDIAMGLERFTLRGIYDSIYRVRSLFSREEIAYATIALANYGHERALTAARQACAVFVDKKGLYREIDPSVIAMKSAQLAAERILEGISDKVDDTKYQRYRRISERTILELLIEEKSLLPKDEVDIPPSDIDYCDLERTGQVVTAGQTVDYSSVKAIVSQWEMPEKLAECVQNVRQLGYTLISRDRFEALLGEFGFAHYARILPQKMFAP